MLDLARVIFEEQSNVANLIHKIMMHTQSLLQCQRCQVLLVDDNPKVSQSISARLSHSLPRALVCHSLAMCRWCRLKAAD